MSEMSVEKALGFADRWRLGKPGGSGAALRTLASEVRRLQAENARLREASVLDTYEACDHNPPAPARRWSSCGTWLYPGESVVVLHAEAAAKEAANGEGDN